MQRLAQIVARCGEEARLRQVGDLQLVGALLDLAFERRVGALQLRRHVVELFAERLQLVAGLDGDAVVERARADAGGAGGERPDRHHHHAREKQRREQRQREAGQQDDRGTRDRGVERLIGLAFGNLHEHQPIERGRFGIRGQHAFAALIERDQRLLGAGRPGRLPRRTDLREPREVGVAQHETDVGVGDQPALAANHIGPATAADMDLADHIPDVREVHFGNADAGFPACAGDRQRHERLAATPEIDGPVVDLVGDGCLEFVFGGKIDVAADPIHGLPRDAQLLPPLVIQQRQLGDRRHLTQQPDAVELALLHGRDGPGQMGGPAEIAFDLPDELGNLRGGRVRLLPLQTHQRGAMLLIGEPDFDQAVADERRAHDGDEQRDILPEQHAMQHAADERPGAAEGQLMGEIGHR